MSDKHPRHIAIIMDGNGRWARARGLGRTEGHRKGMEAARRTVEAAMELGVPYLTLFGFSSENWSRPQEEINDLMGLLRFYLKAETVRLAESGVRLRVIGDRSRLPEDIRPLITQAEQLTQGNHKITVIIALSYGGRQDIVQAARAMASAAKAGKLNVEDINEGLFSARLMTADLPDPDLVIRTSGENRISNFLLWQSAYAEFYFTDTLWPDFSKEDLQAALDCYVKRERRYGGVSAQGTAGN